MFKHKDNRMNDYGYSMKMESEPIIKIKPFPIFQCWLFTEMGIDFNVKLYCLITLIFDKTKYD